MDPLLINPYNKARTLSGIRKHYTEKDLQTIKGKRARVRKVVQPSSAFKLSNKSSIYAQIPSNNTSTKIRQIPLVKLNGNGIIEEPPPLVPFSSSVDQKTNTNYKKNIVNIVTPPPLLIKKIALNEASQLLASSNVLELSMNSEPNSRKKYLVIPNDVLQLFKQMHGSVSINIPGIGAVCVRNPAELTEQKPLENTEKPPKEKKPPKSPVRAEYDPLTDPKFRCWKYRQNVKRDLEGFSYYERMGFYRADVARSAACANKNKLLVHQLELSLKKTEEELKNFKDFTSKRMYYPQSVDIRDQFVMQRYSKNVKRVRDSIIKSRENMKGFKNKNPPDHCYSMSMRRKMLDQDAYHPSGTPESDLLITKKVVILKDQESPPKRRKMSGTQESTTPLNEIVKRKPGRPRKYSDDTPVKRKPGRPKKQTKEIPYKPSGRRNKVKSEQNIDDNKKEADDVKFNTPCYVDLSQQTITKEYLDTLKEFYNNPENLKIITTLREFQSSVDVSKPILVVNKNQWTTINLEESSLTNNIVWPISGSGEFPPWIGLTATTYNIKFVQPDILCKYLSGEREND